MTHEHDYDATLQSPSDRRTLAHEGSLRLRSLSLPPGGLHISGVPQFDQNMDLHLKDNDKIFFGDDDDASLSFDGTDTVLALSTGNFSVNLTDNTASGTITAQHNTLSFNPSGDSSANYDALLLELKPTLGLTDGFTGILAGLRTTYTPAGATIIEDIDDFRHIWINPPTGAIVGKIVDHYGIYIGASTTAAEQTNSYGIWIEDLVGGGTLNPINQNGASGTNIFNAATTIDGVFKVTATDDARIAGPLNIGADADPTAGVLLEVQGFTSTNVAGLLIAPALTAVNDLAMFGVDVFTTYSPNTAGSGNADNIAARFRAVGSPESTHNMRLVQGFEGSANWVTTGTHTLTDLIGLKMRAVADGSTITTLRACAVTFEPSPDTAATVTTGKGYEFDVIWDATNAVTMTDLVGFHMKFTGSPPGGTSITNAIGLEIDEIPTGSTRVPIYQVGASGGNRLLADTRIGGADAAPSAVLHVEEVSTSGAQPVLLLDQSDVSEEFIKFVGTAAAGSVTQSIVDNGDVATATLAGWVRVHVQDDGGQITDQAYYQQVYTLT